MDLNQFRQQNPSYADKTSWPDEKLASGLYNKYYSDQMSMDDFTKSIGLAPATTPKQVEATSPVSDASLSDEQWQAYADKNEAASKAQETGLEEPWINPVDAVVGPLGMPARAMVGKLIGKGVSEATASWGLKKTATAVAASLAAEPLVGSGMEQVDKALTEVDAPLAVKLPVNLVAGMVTGTLVEGGLQSLGSFAKRALLAKGVDATPESVFKVLKELKVEDADITGSEEVISGLVQRPTRPANMQEAVTAITKAKKDKGLDIPEIKAEDIVKTKDVIKDTVKGEAGEHLHGAVLGTAAGVQQDEEGNYSIHPGLMIAGAVAGAAVGQAARIYGGTKKPGIKGGAKQEVKKTRAVAREMKEAGSDVKAIFRETGMWQAADGRWRHEIDDSKAIINIANFNEGGSLSEILDHPVLYEHYPQLKNLMILEETDPRYGGSFTRGDDPVEDVGTLSLNLVASPDPDRTLLHEVQHAVQFIEGHESGGNTNWVMAEDHALRLESQDLKNMLKTADPSDVKNLRKELKKVERTRKRFGMKEEGDLIYNIDQSLNGLDRRRDTIQGKLQQLEWDGKEKSSEYKKLDKQFDEAILQAATLKGERTLALEGYADRARQRYYDILGEQESRSTAERMKMTADLRAKSMPEFENSFLFSEFVNRSGVSATTAAIGGVYSGVDWDEYERTGIIQVDPERMLKGMLLGAASGMGVTAAPKLASHWTSVTKNKIIEPLKDLVNGSITNEAIRYQFGMSRSAEVKAIVKDFKRESELVLRKAVSLGQELNNVAPTSLGQKRLTQVLEGGITTNPTLAKKAHKINAMFKDLKEATRDLNLNMYSRFDKLTRTQRTDLRNIIKNPDTPLAEVQTAQSMLNNYYHTASAKEYLPIFNPQVEGLTKADKNILTDEISNLKKQSRRMNPEGDPLLEDQIAQLEIYLKKGTKKKATTGSITLDQGYSNMRQQLPAGVVTAFNNTIGPAYRVAKGSVNQGLDVLKMQLLKDVEANPEWVWPKRADRTGPTPANYTKLMGKEWGPLQNRRVRNDVMGDLQDVIDTRNGLERNMDKYLGYWKYGKAILNPATHARNAVSNAVLAYFAGVDPTDIGTYTKAASAIKNGRKDQYFREAEGWGLYNNTFIESDISAVRDELDELRGASQLATWIRKVSSLPSAAYDQSERFFKTAIFINQREAGASIDQAAEHAEKYLFNYQDIPPVVKHYKRWAAPFATYTFKAVPLLAETAITKPWKVGAVFGSMYAMTEIAKDKLGVSDKEVATDRDQLLQEKGVGQVLLPFKDDQGNKLYFDAEAFLPWSGVGQTWGQSGIGLGDWLPTHPLFSISAAVVANKELFTGREIYDQVLDSKAAVAGKYIEFAWKQIGPSLAPGGYGFDKLLAGFKNDILGQDVRDYADRKKTMGGAAVSALLGIRLTPANKERLDRFAAMHVRQIQRAVNSRKALIKKRLNRKEIDQGEANRQMQVLMNLHKTTVNKRLGSAIDR